MNHESMISTIRAYGLDNGKIFAAMRKVPRHLFVPNSQAEWAYSDFPLPIPSGQTISQPYTVALMLDALDLRKGHSVLEIGSGSGWVAGLIKSMVGEGPVIALEYHKVLAQQANEALRQLKLRVRVINTDGSRGYKKYAPYNRILVSAACPVFPSHLISQLKKGGIIVCPVGRYIQKMVRYKGGTFESLGDFRFVPLKGTWARAWEG
jgi:protein-L-isoaspartate(D-aspartate) O-methyltransferase